MGNQVILYIAMSLDGFIARKNGSIDWLSRFNSSNEDYGYRKFLDAINTIVMGNRTYRQLVTFGDFPYKKKD